MPYRMLHLADLHLDRSFAGLGCQGDLARRRRQGLREALRAAGQAARDRGCDAVSIGGDLYEHERAGIDTERFLVETFSSWQPMRVLIAPGNHDALLPGSLYRRAEWSDNVHIFTESHFEPVELDDGLTVWGLGHREPAWQGDPFACEPVSGLSGVHLALFHGAELGSRPDGKSIHGPFRVADVHRRGFRVALCGHYHRRRVDKAGGLLYPGSPEPLTFDETGARGPVEVSIDSSGEVRFTTVDLNRWWMASTACDVSEHGSTAAVVDAADAACRAALEALDPEHTMVRIDLTGTVDFSVPLDAFSLEAALRERGLAAHVKVRDLTTPHVNAAAVAAERSTRGAFVRAVQSEMESASDEDEAALLDDVMRYGLMALSGSEVGLR
jgi:exonuclease SbcD